MHDAGPGERRGSLASAVLPLGMGTDPVTRASFACAYMESAFAIEQQIVKLQANIPNDKDAARAAEVRINALKWIASRRNPRVFGDRLELVNGARDIFGGSAKDDGQLGPTSAAPDWMRERLKALPAPAQPQPQGEVVDVEAVEIEPDQPAEPGNKVAAE